MATVPLDLPLHRLDAERYGEIVASGALQGQRVELIDGIIVEMSPQSPEHAAIIRRLMRHLSGVVADLRPQLPLHVAVDSVPEPDLALVDGPEDVHHHPTTAQLVIEVALCTQRLDRGRKAELYAAAGIPTYWVVDVPALAVEVRTDPGPAGYRTLRTFQKGEVVPSPAEGVEPLEVDALLKGLDR